MHSTAMFPVFLALLTVAQASPVFRGPAAPHCVNSIAHISVSGTNFDLSSGTLPPGDPSVPVSGTFGVQLRFCQPTVPVASRNGTLQVLVHGITYNTEYWDAGFQPETYSYVHFAAAQGYATLNMARLGYGESDHPDPLAVVQAPLDRNLLVSIINAARGGRIPGAAGHAFSTIVYAGHSYGSGLLNGVIAYAPDAVDAAIFSGFAHVVASVNVAGIAGVGPARTLDPVRFGDLPDGYVTTANASSRAAAFYGAEGTFDPAALAWDEAHKDTATKGELLTSKSNIVIAPDFRGDVLTINGAEDLFCAEPECSNTASEGEFYPNARSFEFAVVPATGHSLNYHLSAPSFYATLQAWLERHGF